MKINRDVAVGLFVAMRFLRAPGWSDGKLRRRLLSLCEEVPREEIPKTFLGLYDKLDAAVDLTMDEIRWTQGIDFDTLDFRGLKSLIEEHQLGVKPEGKTIEELRAAVEKAMPNKVGRPKGSMIRERPERDALGCIKDSISGIVNACMREEFKSDETIAKEAGLELRQARGRLYKGTADGKFVSRRVFEYKLAPTRTTELKK